MTQTNNKLTESYIYIDSIHLHARHGVLEQEQLTGNDYNIDIRLGFDVARAMETDNVDDTLNYAEVFGTVKEEMQTASKLIEHVAGRIAKRLLREHEGATSVWLRVTKLNPPMGADCRGAGVEIHMTR